MQKLSTVLLQSLFAASIAACATSPTEPTKPTTITMAPGQSSQVGALSLKFVGVTSDTRCPANAMCVQAGDVTVAFEATVLSGRRAFELQLDPAKRGTTHGGYSIELQEVNPYPFDQPIPPGDYRVKLRIAKDIEPARQ